MKKEDAPAVARTNATVRRTRWPGWIWIIPVAALLVVGWWVVRTFTRGGKDITISFDNAHGLKPDNSNVVYRGIRVGKVTDLALAKDGKTVDVTVHVQDNAIKFLTAGTEFWLRGANPSFSDLSSFAAVLTGPTIVMAPGPGKPATHFTGLVRRPVISGPRRQPQLYGVSLSGSVGRLKQGEPVKLRGFTVGEVRDVGFRYDARTGKLMTPVTLALYPALFPIADAAKPEGEGALAAAIDRLVRDGLEARLERDPPLIGDPQVVLEMSPSASGTAPAVVGGLPQIPAAPGGGLNSIVARVNKLPIDQIGQNLLDITRHVNETVSSPQLGDAIAQLDGALTQIHQTADQAGPQITDLVDRLRRTSRQLDDATVSVRKLLGSAPSQNGVPQAMREVTEAARAVRDLANYLDRHPEALIKGRDGE